MIRKTSCLMLLALLPTPTPRLRLVVNIPAYRLDVYVGDSLVRRIAVAPGMPSYPTPRGEFQITSVEWNPWWIPPHSPWAAKDHPTPPGPENPMRRVKLNFLPLYYLHGTPAEQSIGTAASHGCVRLEPNDAIALARLVIRYGAPELTEADIGQLASDTVTTRTTRLSTPISLDLRYDLAELRNGRVYVYRDIYHLATRSLHADVYALFAEHGIDTLAVDPTEVAWLVSDVPRQGKSSPLDSLALEPPDARQAAPQATPAPAARRTPTVRCLAP